MEHIRRAAKAYAAGSAAFLTSIVLYNLEVAPIILVGVVTLGVSAGLAAYAATNTE